MTFERIIKAGWDVQDDWYQDYVEEPRVAELRERFGLGLKEKANDN